MRVAPRPFCEKNIDVGQECFFRFGLVVQCFCCRFAFVCQNMAALSLLQVGTNLSKHFGLTATLCSCCICGYLCLATFPFTHLPGTLLILVQIIKKNIDVGQECFFRFGLVVQCFCCRFAFVCQNMAALSLLQVCTNLSKHIGLTAPLCSCCVCG